jgi:hypothetical protein
MVEIINKYFIQDYNLANITVKSNSLLNSENLEENDKQIISYIELIAGLNIANSNSDKNSIIEHRPGEQILVDINCWVKDVLNLNLRALLFDILQINKIDKFTNAKLAVETYLKICELHDSLSSKREYYVRIINILKGLGKSNKHLVLIYCDKIKEDMLNAEILDECYSITELAKEMIELNLEKVYYAPFANKIENAVELLIEKSEFKYYRKCQEVLAMLKSENSIHHRKEIGNGYFMEADKLGMLENASQHLIAELYKKGLRIFKLLNLKSIDINLFANKLIIAQEKAVFQLEGMKVSSHVFKKEKTLNYPDFENIYQALYWLVEFDLPKKSEFIKEFEKNKNNFIHLQFLSSVITDSKGNTIGVSENGEKVIYRESSIRREIVCKEILKPVYEKFSENFAISEREVYQLVSSSIFISQEGFALYVHGLYNGFCGNFAVAVHLLIPQIEASLRQLLRVKGGNITTKYLNEVQTENGLTSSLNNLRDILHEDLLFDLEGLLNEPFGDNVRNDLSHGLIGISKLHSAPGFYVWWLALKLSLQIERYIITKEAI